MGMAACVAEDNRLGLAESLCKAVQGDARRIFVMFLLVWALSVVLSMIAYIPMIMVVQQ